MMVMMDKLTKKPGKLMPCCDRMGAASGPLSPASPGLLVCFYMCARVGVNQDTPVTPVTCQEIRLKVGFPKGVVAWVWSRLVFRFRAVCPKKYSMLVEVAAIVEHAVPRLRRRLAYCLYLGHHREGFGLQVCQAALA